MATATAASSSLKDVVQGVTSRLPFEARVASCYCGLRFRAPIRRSLEWRPGSDGNGFSESYPIQGPYWGSGSYLEIMKIIRHALRQLKINVTLLNITQMSEFRKDAHTSVFTERKGKLLTKAQRSNPKTFGDCIQWCLPGVTDAWNEILYAYLLKDHRTIL
ncbi:protein trichome birefringence-like 31 [Eucalyptus grandis]|uniref:protein trichome birefringence-like 31 n=1 Tax=Eucalyptus grandis TaxID=71139 RepID=UPI00192E91D0|nr:protein trichome birefringence-like 31 [Eucalyptus grandis]